MVAHDPRGVRVPPPAVTCSVLVIGDALLDVTAIPAEPIRAGADVAARISLQPGGQGANVAVRLARRDGAAELLCSIGDDAAGVIVRDALVAAGVRLIELPADATGTVVVLAGADGDRTMLSQRRPSAAAAARHEWPDCEWVVVSGYVLTEPDADAIVGAIAQVRRRVVLGCSLTESQVAAWTDRVARIRPDLLLINRDERDALGQMPGAAIVVETEADGARASFGDEEVAVRHAARTSALDTTGAGDAFAAGLVAGLMHRSWPPTAAGLRAAMAEGVRLASEVTGVVGAQTRVRSETGGTLRA